MIKFLDLGKVNNRFRDEIDTRIANILDKGWYLQGEENEVFAKHFSEYCGTKYALGVANGLDALRLIIKASGFGEGDEIIVPANTYITTILAISDNGVQTIIHYPTPPHKQPAYQEWNSSSYPITEEIHKTIISLPISPVITDDEVKEVVRTANSERVNING